jgi:alkyl sulfatase BDS1-like metallo-beta-lactamase superfamily hydrolase
MVSTDEYRGGEVTDRRDFAEADRGLIGTLEPMVVTTADGRVVWDMDQWSFLDGDCPDTVHPSLWRQAQLTAKHGLYEVTDGIYQVRGFDMSNMTLVEGTEQRDLYAYLHDQTLRLINQGHVAAEIGEMIEMPPALEKAWHTHGYYGSVNRNVKAIYQRYLGWYDANPAHLWQHPPEAAGKRYVAALGGQDAAVAAARRFLDDGDLRFAAELASHAVFADPDDRSARDLLAEVLEQLGYGAENATWRNAYLSGAHELRATSIEHTDLDPGGLAPALTITQLFDSVAIRIVGAKAWDHRFSIAWRFTDSDEQFHMELSNGALIHHPTHGTSRARDADLTVTLTRPQLLALLTAGATDGLDLDGDAGVLERLSSLTDAPNPDFPIVTP